MIQDKNVLDQSEQFEALFSCANVPIILCSPHLTIIRVNPEFISITGFDPHSIAGKEISVIFPPDTKERSLKIINEVREGIALENQEIPILTFSGGIRYILWNMTQITDRDHQISYILVQGKDISELKTSLKILNDSESRYDRLLSSVTDYTYTVILQNNIPVRTIHGPGCGPVTGYNSDEFEKDPNLWIRMVIPEDKEIVYAQIKAVLSNNEAKPIIHQIRRKDGSIRWIKNTPVHKYDDAGVLIAYDGIIQDITEKTIAEHLLQESERRFRDLFENMSSGVAIYEVRKDGSEFYFKDVNKSVERIEQVSKEDIVGREVSDVFPGVKEFGLFEVFSRVWKTGSPEHYPVSLYKDNRIEGWRDNYVFRLPSGEVVAICDDVTEKMKAVESLKEQEWQFHTMIDFTYDWEYWQRNDGTVVYTSPSCERITGYTPDEFINNPKLLSDIIHPEDLSRFEEQHYVVKKCPEPLFIEYRIVRKDGYTRWIAHVSQLVTGPDGSSLGRRVSNRDITRRKESESEVKIAIQQVAKNQEILATLNDEIRNPLTIIQYYADAYCAEHATIISNEIKRIDEIITMLDQGWLKSDKVRNMLMKHYGVRSDI